MMDGWDKGIIIMVVVVVVIIVGIIVIDDDTVWHYCSLSYCTVNFEVVL